MLSEIYKIPIVKVDDKQEIIEYCVGNKTWHEQTHWIPCDLCKYNPPSNMDGKPCTICPAVRRGESE